MSGAPPRASRPLHPQAAARQVLTLSSGLGPIEARGFVAELADALEQALRREGARVLARRVSGVAAAPRSIDLVFDGGDATRWVGTHALVERSERRAPRGRKRWFVGVSLAAERAEATPSASSNPERAAPGDVEIRFCRARGPGGQHVNRTESAVRARHLPTGIAVRVEDERSRGQNLAVALRRIEEQLAARSAARLAAARDERRNACLAVERGRPVAIWRRAEGRLVEASPGA